MLIALGNELLLYFLNSGFKCCLGLKLIRGQPELYGSRKTYFKLVIGKRRVWFVDNCADLAKHVGESARSRMAGDSLYLELLLEHFLLQNLFFLLS